jgi:glycerol-3-phosphate dehydrogenase (NAD(P)+)
VSLWVYEQDLAERMRSARENDLYLPGLRLPDKIRIVTDFRDALEGAEVVLSATPSHVVRAVCSEMLPWLDPSMPFVSATKGLENNTLLRMSEVIREVVSARFAPRVAALSGPTFAPEVARGEPTALVISSTDALLAETIQLAFSSPTFRVYTNQDPVGVEMGAALKNVIAIGAGVCRGLGLGSNTIAALITRGLVEITRLAVALGGRPATLAGLAGLGDLVLTCTGELSRNRMVGIELGRGRKLADILASMRMVAEGIRTTDAAVELARKYQVDLPITEQMYRVLYQGLSPREAIRELMERSLRGE